MTVKLCYNCADEYDEAFPMHISVPLCAGCSQDGQTQDLLVRAKAEAHSRYVCYLCAGSDLDRGMPLTLKWRAGTHRVCLACSKILDEGKPKT